MVLLRLNASDIPGVAAILSNYVVSTRQVTGCRNVDLCQSVTTPSRFTVIEKWVSADAQERHFNGPVTENLARSCARRLLEPPDIDLLDAISAHDLE